MPELKPASVHVKRHLSRRELATIVLALEIFRRLPASSIPSELRAEIIGDEGIEHDDAIAMLVRELYTARKVKVCRSKRSDA